MTTPQRETADATVADRTPVLEIRNLRKQFRRAGGATVNAIDDVTLSVSPGDFVILLGPSGCGKTTLLRSVAGLETPDSGRIAINGTPVFDSEQRIDVAPEKRRLSMIFQSYALWPHMTVFENVAFPLRSRKEPKSGIAERVRTALAMVGIPDLEAQYTGQMSGGQQQRVALARALVAGDSVILFDEPLSNVDARVREQLRFDMIAMQQELRFAALYVTHDQTEALSLADQIAVMGEGRVRQLGTPRQVYATPSTRYVANFVGTTNEVLGRLTTARDGGGLVATSIGDVPVGAVAPGVDRGDEVVVVGRPERFHLGAASVAGPSWTGVVEASVFLGSHVEHVVRIGDVSVRVWAPDIDPPRVGAEVTVSVAERDLQALAVEAVVGAPADA